MVLKKLAKHAAKAFGLDVVRLSHAPRHTLLGIRSWPIRTVIDVGANTGQFARYIRGMFPEARLYCFEPLPGPYLELRSWAEQCGQNAVITFNTALGDREGTAEMFFHVDHSPSSSILPSTDLCVESYPLTGRQEKLTVELTSLDSMYRQFFPDALDDILVKLDVQGYEDRVIRGAENIFQRAKVCVLEVSLDPLYSRQASFKDIFLLLDSLRFRYAGNLSQIYGDDGHVVFFDAVFVKQV